MAEIDDGLKIFHKIAIILFDIREELQGPNADKNQLKSKMVSSVFKAKTVRTQNQGLLDFTKACERVLMTMSMADVDSALRIWNEIVKPRSTPTPQGAPSPQGGSKPQGAPPPQGASPSGNSTGKAGLDKLCEKYKIKISPTPTLDPKKEDAKEVERVAKKYKIMKG